ncbi:uncharacterized protein B0I36DRAFT_388643 [Microdochium trichocladiopsis]|uniref:Tyrosinase copper-binding domain-containing protein n=1 Tax=Microdochium trichocladiopsis TaxID=1682393 RepID=A0A9P8XXT9_9PEZI|nr:uncharacterized protein B0I36DRAFT_388643 [Microdochium trichocladiopsis]KAH7018433.1 hypothetical protein B0I36DRAFT_388643 [Microdochium trichocladiopsis]
MKLSTTVQALSAAAAVSAAPHSRRQDTHSDLIQVQFPPAELSAPTITLEEAIQLMQPAVNDIADGIVDALDGGRNGDDEDINSTTTPTTASFEEGDETNPPARTACRDSIRPEWNSMSEPDKLDYISAVQCLTQAPPRGGIWPGAVTIWDELAFVHGTLSGQIHGVDTFLPWHRYFLHAYETLLADECGYAGPMPWWRETDAAGDLAGSGLFTPEYFGTLYPVEEGHPGYCISDGPFVGLVDRLHPDGEVCVARGERTSISAGVTVEMQEVCHGGENAGTLPQHSACVELTNHSRLHNAVGPTMARVGGSTYDAIFYLHHAYVDFQWKSWQNADQRRYSGVEGCVNHVAEGGACEPLTLDTVLTSLGLVPDLTVRDVLDTENETMCYTYDDLL